MKKFLKRFLADEGIYQPAGIPSAGYFIHMFLTITAIAAGLHDTENFSHAEIRLLLRIMIVILWILELLKIRFRFYYGYQKNLNTWVPLYFCSITLFAGLLSAFTTGLLQHIGDVFIASGGLIGGLFFLLYPSTSLLLFPADHFLSIHSFLYHGSMTFLGILLNRSGLVNLWWTDMPAYSFYVLAVCAAAWILNKKTGSNLMFITTGFPGPAYKLVKRITGPLYTPAAVLAQMTAPFQFVMLLKLYTPFLTSFQ